MNNFFRLNIYLTIKALDGAQDVVLSASRTIPFQPVEGLVLLLPLSEGMDEDLDPEYPVTLGAPTYSYLESAFVERQEDDSVFDYVREGVDRVEALKQVVKLYQSYGFKKIR